MCKLGIKYAKVSRDGCFFMKISKFKFESMKMPENLEQKKTKWSAKMGSHFWAQNVCAKCIYSKRFLSLKNWKSFTYESDSENYMYANSSAVNVRIALIGLAKSFCVLSKTHHQLIQTICFVISTQFTYSSRARTHVISSHSLCFCLCVFHLLN